KFMDFYSRRANSMISRRIDAVPDSALPAALVLGTAGGLLWSWLRYTILFAICMLAGRWVCMNLSYWPRMTWIDQALSMAVILLPLAGLGVSLELFLSEEPD